MKFAIQGHPIKGKEVIQILESLGGKNVEGLTGTYETFYYIDNKNEIGDDHRKHFPPTYNLYTLEEFEKEFPFKIGDKVIYDYTPNFVGTVVNIKFDNNIPYRVNINGTICTCGTIMLKPYKEMNTRNITLTLEKAKEWYKKGGELKEIALQAFSEKELTKVDLPKTWKEFCKKYPVQKEECWLSDADEILQCSYSQYRTNKNWIPSKKSAEAHLAMMQLEQLRNCWWGDWEPKWNASHKYTIKSLQSEITIIGCSNVAAFLVFPTREMAEEFLECFRDLIEKAGDLI